MKQLERLQSGNAIRVGIVDVEKERELSFIHNINALPTVKVFRYGLRRRPLAYEGPFDLASLVRLLRDAKRVELVAEARSVRELEAFVHETFDASESLLLAYTPSSREEDLLADLEMLLHRLIEVGTACRLFYTTSKHVYDAVASNDSVVDAAKPAMKVLAHVHHINSDPSISVRLDIGALVSASWEVSNWTITPPLLAFIADNGRASLERLTNDNLVQLLENSPGRPLLLAAVRDRCCEIMDASMRAFCSEQSRQRVHKSDLALLQVLQKMSEQLRNEFVLVYSLPSESVNYLEALNGAEGGMNSCQRPQLIIDKYQESALHLLQFRNELIKDSEMRNLIHNFIIRFRGGELTKLVRTPSLERMSTNEPTLLSSLNFEQRVLQNSADVFLFVYAQGCGHCMVLQPLFEEISRHFSSDDIEFFRFDLNRDELPVPIQLDAVPTLLLFQSPLKKERDAPMYVRYQGANTEHELVQFLCELRSKNKRGPEAILCSDRKPAAVDAAAVDSSQFALKDEL